MLGRCAGRWSCPLCTRVSVSNTLGECALHARAPAWKMPSCEVTRCPYISSCSCSCNLRVVGWGRRGRAGGYTNVNSPNPQARARPSVPGSSPCAPPAPRVTRQSGTAARFRPWRPPPWPGRRTRCPRATARPLPPPPRAPRGARRGRRRPRAALGDGRVHFVPG
jgi:hypothetical protein